jgi:cellobiose-specific phosphotransferase system component IIB|tara:strand:+ start:2089 stop:2268 length:180 start_codon:yes stop_codon:yes gene_type:complete
MLKEAKESITLEELQEFESERHKIMIRIIDVCEYGNLDDLKRLNQILIDNNFAPSSAGA